MNPYILFRISGLEGVLVSADKTEFETPGDDLVERVQIRQSGKAIDGMQFFLKNDQVINDSVISAIEKKARIFLVNVNGEMCPFISSFDLKIEQTYDPVIENLGALRLSGSFSISFSAALNKISTIDKFKRLFELQSPRPNADDIYTLLYHIMTIGNVVTRFLMQYELLLTLVAQNRLQKEVSDFVRDKYNPSLSSNRIDFHPTRKTDKHGNPLGYDEDEITYTRNLLGHNDVTLEINDSDVLKMSTTLTQVLYFALNNV